MRILFLASYFPTPDNPTRGNWALEQALIFNQSHSTKVICPTPWFPKLLSQLSAVIDRYTTIPERHHFDDLEVNYLRWIYYPIHRMDKLHRLAPRLFLWLGWISIRKKICGIIDQHKPDVVYAHHTLVNGYVAMKLHERYKIPYVITDHEIGDYIKAEKNESYLSLFQDIGNTAYKIITVSTEMQKKGESIFKGGNFRTIYNGSSFTAPEKEAKMTKNLTIFCCSKFYGRKDIPLLLNAFDELGETHPDLSLRIAGDGPDREIIYRIWGNMKHQGRVEFLGLVSPDTVKNEMLNADIFALAGWAEPFGVVFLEAMAYGLPIVVSEDAGIAEALTYRENCLFSKPHDLKSVVTAIEILIHNPKLRQTIGKHGQDHFRKKFQWSSVAMQYFDEFERSIIDG